MSTYVQMHQPLQVRQVGDPGQVIADMVQVRHNAEVGHACKASQNVRIDEEGIRTDVAGEVEFLQVRLLWKEIK